MDAPSLKLIVLKTNNVESLRAFYTRLGFRFVEEQHGKGPLHFSAPLGDGILEIYPLPDGALADTTTRLGFAVSGVDSINASLIETEYGVSKPKQTEWGLRAVVRDPDGRTVELYEAT
jgi:catechol 2,3-dioxygenase-like lactoylglutathione lyase family enzyme